MATVAADPRIGQVDAGEPTKLDALEAKRAAG